MQNNMINQSKASSHLFLSAATLMEHAGIALIRYLEKEILEKGKTISDEDINSRCKSYSEAIDTGFNLLLKTVENRLLEQCRELEFRAENLHETCQKLEARYRTSVDMITLQSLSDHIASDHTVSDIASQSCDAAHSDKERERVPSQILSSNPSEPETSPEASWNQSQRGASDAAE
ncbi:hypothetical protein KG383_004194 [Salmonella enterica subsp. enterica serovar Newport]|nr:hypothetical protein [Salmonella enterica subsp. enterica serovar Newport]